MRRSLLAAFVVAVTASPAHAILDGQPDAGHGYVVAVRSPTGGVCTGSVISAHRVLTAAHCMAPGSTAKVVFGTDARTSTSFVFGTFRPHPGWCPGCAGGVPGIDTNDVAVIVVSTEMPGPYASLPPLGFAAGLAQKETVTSVGYGIRVRAKDFAGQVLERYSVTSELVDSEHRISDEYLRLSASKGGTCNGDSGGPGLVGDTIVGITAFALNGNCAGVTYAQRIDIFQTRGFIDSFVP